MNFRLTGKKLIASFIIPAVIWILVFFIGLFKISNLPSIIANFLALHNFSNFLSTGNIALFGIEIIMVYIFLSIFHRKKKKTTAYQPEPIPAQPAV